MAFSAESQPAKRRGRARFISRAEADAALDRLRALAEKGDPLANLALIDIAARQRQEAV